MDQILQQEGEGYRGSQVGEMMLKGSIHANTAFHVSTEHLAEMMIQGSNRGITSMYKSLKHNRLATDTTVELAKELMDFEEKSIERLKEYLWRMLLRAQFYEDAGFTQSVYKYFGIIVQYI